MEAGGRRVVSGYDAECLAASSSSGDATTLRASFEAAPSSLRYATDPLASLSFGQIPIRRANNRRGSAEKGVDVV
jgi:hypothetical protein